MLTQLAPPTLLISAFKIGQSATASLPSFIDSVSRFGEATDPESRWSLPMTIGALNSPDATMSFIILQNLARSPYPGQQLRGGKPWKLIFFRAIRIQWQRCSL